MENYTAESKSKAIYHDNYTETHHGDCVTCWMCIYCGKNQNIPVFQDNLLCAKYTSEIAIVKGKGTCDSARSRFKWFNFVNPIKKMILERHGFDFKAR